MNSDDQFERMFRDLDFSGEPPMTSSVADDVHRGQRGLRRRRIMTGLSAAAATAVVATGIAIAVPSENDAGGEQNVAGATDSPAPPDTTTEEPPPETEDADTETSQALEAEFPTMDLTEDELRTYLQECADTADGQWAKFEPVLGVRADVGADDYWAAAGWLIGRADAEWLACEFDSAGELGSAGIFGTEAAKDIPYLYAPVDPIGTGHGRYISSIARVTVQLADGPERTATMRDGFWFVPVQQDPNNRQVEPPPEAGRLAEEEARRQPEEVAGGGTSEVNAPGSDLINIPAGTVVRGYDGSGELVYDSAADGPSVEDCYADPEGKEVIANYDVDNPPDPDTCRRTFEWTH